MKIDHYVASYFDSLRGRLQGMDAFFLFCTKPLIWLMGLALAAQSLFVTVEVVVAAWVVAVVLQLICHRLRPFQTHHAKPLDHVWTPTPSFPSAHATIAFVIAASAWQLDAPFFGLYVLAAFLVAISRLYAGVHFFSDVAVGAILGSLISLALL